MRPRIQRRGWRVCITSGMSWGQGGGWVSYETMCGQRRRHHKTLQKVLTNAPATCLNCIAGRPPSLFVNSNFARKLAQGRTKEAEAEGTSFIREMLRKESFTREIIEPVLLTDDEINKDEED